MYQVLLLHGQIEMSTFFEFPTLPDGSHLQRSGDSVSILCGKRNINWQSKSGDSTILTQLLQELKDGLFPVNSYYARYPKLNLTQLFDSLDTYGLLCEGPHPDTGARHGKCVITRLEQEYRRRGEACQSSILWPLLDSGQASAKLLSGLAAEYYFLTTGAYDALSPAICRLQGEHKMHAINFMLGEYRHDKFMLKSWQACGVSDATVARALPHPYTRAVSNLLGYWAECDQFSFMAALFIVEGLDDNEAQYIELLKKIRCQRHISMAYWNTIVPIMRKITGRFHASCLPAFHTSRKQKKNASRHACGNCTGCCCTEWMNWYAITMINTASRIGFLWTTRGQLAANWRLSAQLF
jgi:hypothetical protein